MLSPRLPVKRRLPASADTTPVTACRARFRRLMLHCSIVSLNNCRCFAIYCATQQNPTGDSVMATTTKTAPKFEMPKFDMSKFNFDALVALHKANVDTMMEAQGIWMQTAEAVAKLQYTWVEETFKQGEAMLKGDVTKKKPEEFMADAKAAADKVMAVAKEQADLGMKAQKQVADLVTKRVNANLEDVKALAA
jgi:phasin family protein